MRRLITRAQLLLLACALLALAAPARAASPMIRGWAWVDQNCDGIRQDEEPASVDVTWTNDQGSQWQASVWASGIRIYRFGVDEKPFTDDDKLIPRILYVDSDGAYIDSTDSVIMLPELYRLSILQGGRPAGYLPTKYRAGGDPDHWSSLQGNWTTGDPNNGGFQLDPNGTVTGGNIGIAPLSCTDQWYTEHVYLPLALR